MGYVRPLLTVENFVKGKLAASIRADIHNRRITVLHGKRNGTARREVFKHETRDAAEERWETVAAKLIQLGYGRVSNRTRLFA